MRARLSRAAYEVIAERGHSGFRTAAVATRAGVSQGALLHHFPTKEAVTLAAIEQALSYASMESRKRLTQAKPPAETLLKSMLADFRAFFQGDRFWVALDITMDASKNSGLAPEIGKLVAHYRKPIYGLWAERLVACGWSQERAASAVAMTSALTSGFAIRSLWTQDGAALKRFDEQWLDFLSSRQ